MIIPNKIRGTPAVEITGDEVTAMPEHIIVIIKLPECCTCLCDYCYSLAPQLGFVIIFDMSGDMVVDVIFQR